MKFKRQILKSFFILFSVASAILTQIKPSPLAEMNFMEMVKAHGYPVWSKFLETPDGYILNIFRIPGKKGESLASALAQS